MEGYLSTGGRLPAANFLTYQLRCAEIEQFNRSAIAIRWDSLAQGARPKSPAEFRHRRAGEPTNLPRSHPLRTLPLRHHWLLKKGENCNLCARYDLLPVSQVAYKRVLPFVQVTNHATPSTLRYSTSEGCGRAKYANYPH